MPSLGRDLLSAKDSLAVEAYRQRLLSALELNKPGKGRRALDLGCGDGLEAVYLARLGYKVEALDLQAHPRWKALERQWKGRLKFRIADVAQLKKLKSSYDLVFEKDMLHHVDEPVAVLREMKRLLKKGGRAVVVECNRWNPIFYVHLTLMEGHEHFTRRELRRLLEAAGLAGYALRLREARVWPVERAWLQGLMNALQDLAERIRILDPWLCYHLVSWEKK